MKKLLLGLVFAVFAASAFAQNINRTGTIMTSAVRAATTNGQDMSNDSSAGIQVVFDITVAPGVDTVTVTIQGKDPVSGKYYTLLAGAAESATGTKTYTVYPGIAVTANVSASTILPKTWRVIVTHSAATSFTYSLGYSMNY